jgi:hypothetical protein
MHSGIINCTAKTQEIMSSMHAQRRKLAINILSLQSSIYVVLGNPSIQTSLLGIRILEFSGMVGYSGFRVRLDLFMHLEEKILELLVLLLEKKSFVSTNKCMNMICNSVYPGLPGTWTAPECS